VGKISGRDIRRHSTFRPYPERDIRYIQGLTGVTQNVNRFLALQL